MILKPAAPVAHATLHYSRRRSSLFNVIQPLLSLYGRALQFHAQFWIGLQTSKSPKEVGLETSDLQFQSENPFASYGIKPKRWHPMTNLIDGIFITASSRTYNFYYFAK